jgi:hypothetical protein
MVDGLIISKDLEFSFSDLPKTLIVQEMCSLPPIGVYLLVLQVETKF